MTYGCPINTFGHDETDTQKGWFHSVFSIVTLIDVMLLGHWLEVRSVRQASGALGELAELMPDTAERIKDDDSAEEIKVTELGTDDRVLVRPGPAFLPTEKSSKGNTM